MPPGYILVVEKVMIDEAAGPRGEPERKKHRDMTIFMSKVIVE